MLKGLAPHSAYMNAHEFREMAVHATGEFGGVGIEVALDHGLIKIVSRMDDTPASRAGIEAGDIITNVNGESVQGVPIDDLLDQMRGLPNTIITLTVERQGISSPLTVSMRREIIHIQVTTQRMSRGILATCC